MKNGQSVLKLLALIFAGVSAVLLAGGTAGALYSGIWLFASVMWLVGAVFLLTSGIVFAVYKRTEGKKRKLTAAGKYVYAQIVDIDVSPYQEIHVDRISMNPFFIRCRYTDNNGKTYDFKSGMLLYNPSGLLRSRQLKVYVDLSRPDNYYVDTNEILPEGAVLHKFKFDSENNAERLKAGGNYIQAVTCGVELAGRIKVNGMFKPGFLKLPQGMELPGLAADEKGRAFAGYTVLCRYDAPDGTVHIFASKGIWGEPDSSHVGEPVRVYYDGEGYRNYHVDMEPLLK